MLFQSHWLYAETFVKSLLERGHEVTCVTSFRLSGPKQANYTEVLIDPPFDLNSFSKYKIRCELFWKEKDFSIFEY